MILAETKVHSSKESTLLEARGSYPIIDIVDIHLALRKAPHILVPQQIINEKSLSAADRICRVHVLNGANSINQYILDSEESLFLAIRRHGEVSLLDHTI
jgi:hypothetical protein